MRQFKFNHKDIKAFSIIGISVGSNGKKFKKNSKCLSKNFTDMNSEIKNMKKTKVNYLGIHTIKKYI